MLHPRAPRTTSIRRTAGITMIGAIVGAGALLTPGAVAYPTSEPVTISFYDYPSEGDRTTDLAFFMWPEGYEGDELAGRLLNAAGALKGPAVPVLSYDPGSVEVESITAGDIAELYDPTTDEVLGRAVYTGNPGLSTPLCAGATSATGTRTAGEPIGNVEAFTAVPGAQSSGDVKINPATIAEQADGGTAWSATFEQPVAAGDHVNVFASVMRDGVRVQSFAQRTVTTCATPAPAPTPVPAATPVRDMIAPAGTSTLPKGSKKVGLASLATKGIAFNVTAQENATLKAKLTLRTTSGKGKKKKVKEQTVGTTTQPVSAGVATTVKLKARKSASATLKKASKQTGSKLVATITLTDASGNVTTLPSTTLSVPKR